MDSVSPHAIPDRAATLAVLRLVDAGEPMLMLTGDGEGYGTRWTVRGQQVQPAIARYLMAEGYVAEAGRTGFGARRLALTEAGAAFRAEGLRWWSALSLWQKFKITVFG